MELLQPHLPLIAAATAAGALGVSVWGLKDYLIGGRNYIVKALKKRLPSTEIRSTYSARGLRAFHNLLRSMAGPAPFFRRSRCNAWLSAR